MEVKRELGNTLGLKGKGTFEKNYKINKINWKCSNLSVFNNILEDKVTKYLELNGRTEKKASAPDSLLTTLHEDKGYYNIYSQRRYADLFILLMKNRNSLLEVNKRSIPDIFRR